jgi:phosphatidate cytidylyltransferase
VTISYFIRIKNFLNIENFRIRSITTLILFSFFSLLFWLGELFMSLFFILLFAGVLYELKLNFLKKVTSFHKIQILIIPFLLFLCFVCEVNKIGFENLYIDNYDIFLASAIVLSVLFFGSLSNVFYSIISILVVISFFSIIQILLSTNGLYIVFYLVVLVTSMDIFAYIGGNIFGKIKIAPSISHGKTVEGTIIGLFFTIIMSIVLKDIVSVSFTNAIFLGFVIGILAFLGDLIESIFKRKIGVKDSGTLIPGHGGLLDRFDGYLLLGPFTFLFFNFLI